MRRSFQRAWAVSALAVTSVVSIPAWAHGTSATREPPELSELPPGPVKRTLLDVEKKRRAAEISEDLLAEPMEEARLALERSRGADAAGDGAHAPLLVRLAKRWANVATALVTAAIKEKSLSGEAKRLEELETKVERAETLLSEQQARLGRLRARLEKAEKEHADKRSEAPGASKRGPSQ